MIRSIFSLEVKLLLIKEVPHSKPAADERVVNEDKDPWLRAYNVLHFEQGLSLDIISPTKHHHVSVTSGRTAVLFNPVIFEHLTKALRSDKTKSF
jgi:hypothetical protein